MNIHSVSESTVGGLIGGSERLQDVAYSAAHPRKQGASSRRYPKSALQKLLSMVEPIMHPLRNEHHDTDKDELHSTHSIDAILSNPGQRNSFQVFLQDHTPHNSLHLREFQFLCLCRQFRDWDEKLQYGPYRIRVLANHIYQNFIRDNAPHALEISAVVRKKIERTIQESKVPVGLFEEVYQQVALLLLQQHVVKKFLESGYYQTMLDADEVDWHLKGLSLGPPTVSRCKFSGSLGSSTSSSSLSSRSKLSSSNFLGQSMSSELSSAGASEIQSVSSSRTGSSKGSTGSNASVAYDKYYINKNSHKRSRKKPPVDPKKLMEELLPRLEAIAIEQNIRVQNYGTLESGPDGGDTPIVIINTRNYSAPCRPLGTDNLDHMTHHALPHTLKSAFPRTVVRPATFVQGAGTQDTCTRSRERSESGGSLEDMVCEENPSVSQPLHNPAAQPLHNPTHAWINTQGGVSGGCDRTPNKSVHTESACDVTANCDVTPVPPGHPGVHIAYSFCSEEVLYGKVVPGPSVTLSQFKDVVTWSNRTTNARYFFKRQLPGIGEVHDEISCDESVLPFWTTNTIFARVESGA